MQDESRSPTSRPLRCEHCGEPLMDRAPASQTAGEFRCTCGCLMARAVEGGLELKCRRCKRTLVVRGVFELPASQAG